MTEPQVWTLIGIFAGGMLATATLISTLFLRIMQNGFDGIGKEFENVRKEFTSVRTEFSSEFSGVRTG
ncbi:hypothetical protein AB0O87_01880 [Microbacterium sp. NPDC076768]|uniref:hypothetical protein n=1 Tax=Microbacterium sp. NPDC076768 TaxID=3154858 RepID=UPI003432B99A